jgi:hypothetical protein
MPQEFTVSRFNPISRSLSSPNLGRLAGPAGYAVFILVGLAVWLRFLNFPTVVGGEFGDVDGSWNQSYGYFLKNHFQAGKDYIFTYGPLGYFHTAMYDSELFWHKYVWELAVKFVFAAAVMRFTRHLAGRTAKLLFCLLALVFIAMTELIFPLLMMGVITVKEGRYSPPYLAAVALFLAVISLVKFTYFMYSAPVVCLISLGMLGGGRRWAAVLPPALYAAAFSLAWVAAGQSLANVPRYLSGSLEISAGYDEGMGVEGNPAELYLAGVILVTFWATLLPFSARDLPAARRLGGLRQLSLVGLLAVTAFLEWKHGFVRHGGISVIFFCFFVMTPFLLPGLFPDFDWGAAPRARLTTACFCMSLAGVAISGGGVDWITYLPSVPGSVVDTARVALDPSRLRGDLERLQAEKAEASRLPAITSRVGRSTVDVISVEQGVLLLNKMNWRPRPVFQSYSAYTPFLQSANARFFRSEAAPEYVIFRLEPLDGRFPTLDEGQALLEVLRRYRPVLAEKGYLLLERQQGPVDDEALAGEVVLEKRVPFGEEVDLGGLPGKYHTLALKFTPSRWGRLRKFLYKPPEVSIHVRTDPDHDPVTYRLIPSMAECGFVLNPLLGGWEDVMNLYDYDHPVGNMVTSFSVTCGAPGSYDDDIAVTVKSFPRLVGCRLDPAVRNQARYPMMRTPFVRATAKEPISAEVCDGREVLRVHAPSEVVFNVPPRPGPRRVSGKFGILPDAYENTDGVQFAVEYTPRGGTPAVLFDKFLDPHSNPQDRGAQDFATSLPPGGEGTLVLKTFNPPDKNEHYDWSYWTDFEIEGDGPRPDPPPEAQWAPPCPPGPRWPSPARGMTTCWSWGGGRVGTSPSIRTATIWAITPRRTGPSTTWRRCGPGAASTWSSPGRPSGGWTITRGSSSTWTAATGASTATATASFTSYQGRKKAKWLTI